MGWFLKCNTHTMINWGGMLLSWRGMAGCGDRTALCFKMTAWHFLPAISPPTDMALGASRTTGILEKNIDTFRPWKLACHGRGKYVYWWKNKRSLEISMKYICTEKMSSWQADFFGWDSGLEPNGQQAILPKPLIIVCPGGYMHQWAFIKTKNNCPGVHMYK